jgi:hypothetical protein
LAEPKEQSSAVKIRTSAKSFFAKTCGYLFRAAQIAESLHLIRPKLELTSTTHRMTEGVLSQSIEPGDGVTIDSFELDLSSLPAFSPLNKLMSKPSNKKHQEFICHISLEAAINPPGTSHRPAQASNVLPYF